MNSDVDFWKKCLNFARGRRCPEPEDAAQEMFAQWLADGKPEAVRLDWLFARHANKSTKWDKEKKQPREPVVLASRGDGEDTAAIEHIRASTSTETSLDDETLDLLTAKLKELEKLKKKQRPPVVPEPEDSSDWPLPVCTLAELEHEHIRQMLARFRGNRSQAAIALGISVRCLRYKIAASSDIPKRLSRESFFRELSGESWRIRGPALRPRETHALTFSGDRLVIEALKDADWNVTRAAAALGMNRTTMHERLKAIDKANAFRRKAEVTDSVKEVKEEYFKKKKKRKLNLDFCL